jgi:4-oxalocrotonate tautomerase
MATLHYGEESVSVAIEEVKAADWTEKLYKPDILGRRDTLYKEPGYDLSGIVALIAKPRPLRSDGAMH